MASNIILLISIGFLFVLKRTGPGSFIHIGSMLFSYRALEMEPGFLPLGQLHTAWLLAKTLLLSASFHGQGYILLWHKETLPSLVHKACSSSSPPLSLLFSFSEGSIFFIYIRILVDVLFTYVFTHFG